ncbi:MAG: glycerol-3-phosphate 1-O-acyltransferase PlsY [Janthinobacterium lividum]
MTGLPLPGPGSYAGAGLLVAVLAYLAGSVAFGLLLTRLAGLGDLRAVGSGNIGATNVLRTGRRGLAAATLLLDAAKGLLAVVLAGWALGGWAAAVAAVCVVAGHCFPAWLRFRGGKGVATGLGAMLGLDWRVGLAACAAWLLAAWLSRVSSVGALAAMAAGVAAAGLLMAGAGCAAAVLVAALVVARHHGNIRRLAAGTEPRIGARA